MFSDELTPATAPDAWALAGVLALMLPIWLAITALIMWLGLYALSRVDKRVTAKDGPAKSRLAVVCGDDDA